MGLRPYAWGIVDDRIFFDDEESEPPRSPVGLTIGVIAVVVALAVIALRPSDVNPNSLSASPPTTLLVPPEAVTTTTITPPSDRSSPLSLGEQVPGLRGAVHMQVSTATSGQEQRPTNQLWVWSAAFDEPTQIEMPGAADISANRRNALATSWNTADEGVLWLGPKADVQPAQILPGLTNAVWNRDSTSFLVTAQVADQTTTLIVWQFSGADSQPVETVTLEGEWGLAYFSGDVIAVTTRDPETKENRSRLIDWRLGTTETEVPGVLVGGTSGPPVLARCRDNACFETGFAWFEDGMLVPAPGNGWPVPSPAGPYVAVFDWQDATSRTVIYDRDGNEFMSIPSHGFSGAWSGDGRFFVFSRSEAGFGDPPALVFVDTLEETYHEVTVPSAGDWFVTRIWYGP